MIELSSKLARMPFINFIAYQMTWFACIVSAAKGSPWIGSLCALIVVFWHLSAASKPKDELALIAVAGIIGLVWESLLVYFGFISYPSGNFLPGIAPHWIIALWLVFATTFNVSLKWFKQHLAIVSLLGCLGGPLAFYAGAAMGALTLEPNLGLLSIAIGWGLMMPLLLLLARRFDGMN